MQHVATDLQFARTKGASPQRVFIVGAVGALHLLAIYALLMAFHVVPQPKIIRDSFVRVIPDTTQTAPPPQPGPTVDTSTFAKPTAPTAHEPPINTDQPPCCGTLTEPPRPSGPTVGAQLLTRAIPPYPMLDVRLGHEGIVSLKLAIDANGTVTDAVVTRSSGFDTLDAAAVAWVKAKWRYKPAQQNGQTVATTSLAAVKFELKNR